jgi:hypothetical protein
MMPSGITAVQAGDNLRLAFIHTHGSCTSAEFAATPEGYINEWLGSLVPLYVAAGTRNL